MKKTIIQIDDSGWGCEKIDAEIFTNHGWKYYDNLVDNDKVMTYLDDGNIKWSKFTNKIDYEFSGEMNHFSNRSSDIIVTDEHHFKVLKRVGKRDPITKKEKTIRYRSEYIGINDLVDNDRIPRTGNWIGEKTDFFVLPAIKRIKSDNNTYKDILIPMKNWLAFFGIWITEGCILQYGYSVIVSQKKEPQATKIREMLSLLPFRFSENITNKGCINFICRNKQLWSYLAKFGNCYSKHIPRKILDLDKEYLEALYHWMVVGDGNICKSHESSMHTDYYTVSKKLKDNFQEIILKLGCSFNTTSRMQDSIMLDERKIKATVPCYEISVRNGKCITVGSLNHSKVFYTGRVFDLEVPEGRCFYVRRNGIGYFTGNSILGGVCIGIYNVTNDKMYSRLIPVKYFQGRKFKDQEYLDYAWHIAMHGVLNVLDEGKLKTESVLQICRGYLLSKIRGKFLQLHDKFIKVNCVDIKDPLQSALERKFSQSLARCGVPKKSEGAHRLSFNDMIEWLKEDPSRAKYAKTGWKSWKRKYKKTILE